MNNFTEILKKCETYEQLCVKTGVGKFRAMFERVVKPHIERMWHGGPVSPSDRARFNQTGYKSFFEQHQNGNINYHGNNSKFKLTQETIDGINNKTINPKDVAREQAHWQGMLEERAKLDAERKKTFDDIAGQADSMSAAGTPAARAKLQLKRAAGLMTALGTLYLLFSGKNPTTDNPAKKVIIDDVKNSSIKSSNPETKEVIENYNKLNSMLTTLISSANDTVKLTEKDKVVLMLFISKNNEIITALNDLGGTDLSLDDVSQLRSFAAKVSSLETKLSKHKESLGQLKEKLIKTNRSGMAEICGLAIDHSSKYIESIKDQRSKLQGIA